MTSTPTANPPIRPDRFETIPTGKPEHAQDERSGRKGHVLIVFGQPPEGPGVAPAGLRSTGR